MEEPKRWPTNFGKLDFAQKRQDKFVDYEMDKSRLLVPVMATHVLAAVSNIQPRGFTWTPGDGTSQSPISTCDSGNISNWTDATTTGEYMEKWYCKRIVEVINSVVSPPGYWTVTNNYGDPFIELLSSHHECYCSVARVDGLSGNSSKSFDTVFALIIIIDTILLNVALSFTQGRGSGCSKLHHPGYGRGRRLWADARRNGNYNVQKRRRWRQGWCLGRFQNQPAFARFFFRLRPVLWQWRRRAGSGSTWAPDLWLAPADILMLCITIQGFGVRCAE